jgi:hypothetical protein
MCTNLEDIMLSEISQSGKIATLQKFLETESRSVAEGAEGREKWEFNCLISWVDSGPAVVLDSDLILKPWMLKQVFGGGFMMPTTLL